MSNNELVSTLNGNVIFDYEDLTIRSDNARWWRNQGIIKVMKNVRLQKPNLRTTCDDMTFYKDRSMLYIQGNVVIEESKNKVRVTGDDGRYDLRTKLFTLNRKPVFMKFDTAAAETLVIVSRQMSYSDSLNIAVAEQDVRITKGKLLSTCNRCRYDTKNSKAYLRGDPGIIYDVQKVTGDSVDLFFAGDTLKGLSVQGNSHGQYREAGSRDSSDTNITHIWSDSMYMVISPAGRLDSIRAYRNVHSTYYLAESENAPNEVTGKVMILAFDTKGDLSTAVVFGNATSIYYVKDDDGRGRNEASGDSIHVVFDNGKAKDLTLVGAVRGVYFSLAE